MLNCNPGRQGKNISKMFITGPDVIKTVLGEEISMEEPGGARIHSVKRNSPARNGMRL